MGIFGKEQVGNANVEVLKDIVGENQQKIAGKTFDLNGTVTFGQVAILNPNLGNGCEIQFRMMQEVVGALEHNAMVLEE